MNDHGFASAAAVKQFLKTANTYGVDYHPLLAKANIAADLFDNNNQRIPGLAMEQLLALLIDASGDPCFGLRSSRLIEPASYSVLGYASMNCANLRELLARVPVYEKIVNEMGESHTDIADGFVLQRWQCHFSNPQVKRHMVESVLGSWHTYTRSLLDFDGGLIDSICFEHAAPTDAALLPDYTELFGCPVHFEQAASGIRFREALLDLPFPQADEKLLQTLLDHASQQLAEMDRNQSITDQVKNLLRLLLKEQVPTSTVIAEKLCMSSRTLQRKLSDENTHYKDVLNELRLELALHYLENTELPLESIAHELGYAEARSFYRSFKQWTGRTAGAYRAHADA